MKDLWRPDLNPFRVGRPIDEGPVKLARARRLYFGDNTCGDFRLTSPIDGGFLFVIASSGENWDHVSVSRKNRCPNWPEMEFVRKLFFKPDETCFQLGVPEAEHINCHPHCLHWWRSQLVEIPRPPGWMVGPETPKPEEVMPEEHAED